MDVLYWRPPSQADLAEMWWHTIEDFPPPPPVEVWADNWESLQLFLLYQGQWRFTEGQAVALDLNVFQHHLRAQGIEGVEFAEFMSDLAVISTQALTHINK